MRKAMINAVSRMICQEEDTCLFLVDIGVWALRDILSRYPKRALNAGIFEDGMIGVAAGMALGGFIPTVYGISPFLINRANEQLKLDFAYQKLQGNFITTGASYDFSTLGYSHYCPEDLGVIQLLPGFEFAAPGAPEEFNALFAQAHRNGMPTYWRCSDHCNQTAQPVQFGKANVIRTGTKATVIAVSTTLDMVLEACQGMDVSILYYTTLIPFDADALRQHYNGGNILLCEPHYEGTLAAQVYMAFAGQPVRLRCVGVRREVLRSYGTKQDLDKYNGLTPDNVRNGLRALGVM